MVTEKVFKTKTGYCHVLQDKIVLTTNGVIDNVAKMTTTNNIATRLFIYALLSLIFILLALMDFINGQILLGILFLFLGLFLVFGVTKSLNNSTTPIIDRGKIKEIEFIKAIAGATRSYFIVHFENNKGQIKRRLIFLPGSLNNGKIETKRR